jgi:GMP synthase (glutamine-hydrolysing)
MRVLLVSLCSDPLSELEFVRPIEQILRHQGISFFTKHYTKVILRDVDSSEKVIICGSALRDNAFLEGEQFTWLERSDKPTLGIGSGYQLITKILGCDFFDKTKIGVFRVRLTKENKLADRKYFYAYFLTNRAAKITKPLETLAKAGVMECMVKHEFRGIYGCLFHPEVMNPEIIVNFVLKFNKS